mgnify:CR=1 FL=1
MEYCTPRVTNLSFIVVLRLIVLSMLGLAVPCLTAEEKKISTALPEPANEETSGVVLRPVWQAGKAYRMQQRLEARATVAGLGKQLLEWRQQLRITPHDVASGYKLEIGVDNLRVDLDLGGQRSRYYFEPNMPLKHQNEEGIQAALLSRVERLVNARYMLSSNNGTGTADIKVLPAKGTTIPKDLAIDEGLAALPWQAVTSALLQQGIPETSVHPGDDWQHQHHFTMPHHGEVEIDLECHFKSYKKIKNQRYALIECEGAIRGTFRQHLPEQEEPGPGLGLDAPKVKGLTLIDPVKRTIASTVFKIDGKLTSLGIPGAEEGETAPIKKTLTLTLLAIEEITNVGKAAE